MRTSRHIILSSSQIIYFDWRQDSKNDATSVLLCRDSIGVARVWEESPNNSKGLKFSVVAVIPSSKECKSNIFQFLTGDAFRSIVINKMGTVLQETFTEYPTMIFQIDKEGAMVIWGLNGLSSSPRKSVKCNLLMKTNKNLIPAHARSYQNITVYHDESLKVQNEVKLIISSIQYSSVYGMNLDDYFTKAWVAPRLSHKFSFSGPKSPVAVLIPHVFKGANFVYTKTGIEDVIYHVSAEQVTCIFTSVLGPYCIFRCCRSV